MARKKICLISGGHVSSTPRLIKEADALYANGYDVLVLSTQGVSSIAKFDRDVQAVRSWRVYNVPLYDRSWLSTFISKVSKRLARKHLFSSHSDIFDYVKVAAPWHKLFLVQIERFQPDFIIAHSISGLTVAALAKRMHGIPFGFDVEDYHAGEREGGLEDFSNRLGFNVMRMCLPEACYATISSPQIETEIQKHFRIAKTEIVLNCFPLQPLEQRDSKNVRLSLYWFSQSIGMDRGLPDILEACQGLRGDFELHLRGSCSDSVRNQIFAHADRGGYRKNLFLDPRCGADELLTESMKHDVGLALEFPTPFNRNLCITNKILMYSIAGLAIAATATDGQCWVMNQMPEAGFIYNPGDVSSLQKHIQSWLDNRGAMLAAKRASRRAAEERFSWERESAKFLKIVESALT
jgi:glycosyltransferase involved in cell wall biosynthesis